MVTVNVAEPQCFYLPDFPMFLVKDKQGLIDLALKLPRRNSAPIHFSKCVIYNHKFCWWTILAKV